MLRGTRGNRTLIELNFLPASSSSDSQWWTGDGAGLMRNALMYSRSILCGSGTFSAGETAHSHTRGQGISFVCRNRWQRAGLEFILDEEDVRGSKEGEPGRTSSRSKFTISTIINTGKWPISTILYGQVIVIKQPKKKEHDVSHNGRVYGNLTCRVRSS